MLKPNFLTTEKIEAITNMVPTPFHIYDEKSIRENVHALQKAFAWNAGFREYFAVKATPNPVILKCLTKDGLGLDCSSLAELVLAETIGASGETIMFTSNNTPLADFQKAHALNAIINLDDLGHFAFLQQHKMMPDLICFRYNPGRLKEGNIIIGKPEEAKFGVTRAQLFQGFQRARDHGIKRFGLHTMVASNELNPTYFVETAVLLFNLVVELSTQLNIRFEFVNLGGGFGIPYRPEEKPLDVTEISDGIRQAYEAIIVANGLNPLKLFLECGRFITGPYGCLVTRVQHIKHTYKTFVGVDATMADLMRPGMYGAYHHITVPGKAHLPSNKKVDVTGSLCENNDKFAVDRRLPQLEIGDLLVIHDTGAHGRAMGFNYNGRLRSAELLLRENGEVVQIRRAETLDDYFATLNFEMIDHLDF